MSNMLEMAHCRIEKLEDTLAGLVNLISRFSDAPSLSNLESDLKKLSEELSRVLN